MECLAGADTGLGLVVGPWQYQYPGGWVGWGSTRYTHPPTHPALHHRWVVPSHRTLYTAANGVYRQQF